MALFSTHRVALQRAMQLLSRQSTLIGCHAHPAASCSYMKLHHYHQVCHLTRFNYILTPSANSLLPRRDISAHHEGSEGWKDLDYTEMELMTNQRNVLIIDVRERNELDKTGQIGASINIPLGDLHSAFSLSSDDFQERYKVKKPDTDDSNVILHCLGGIRSKTGLDILKTLGYNKFRHFPGGWEEWSEKKNLPS